MAKIQKNKHYNMNIEKIAILSLIGQIKSSGVYPLDLTNLVKAIEERNYENLTFEELLN